MANTNAPFGFRQWSGTGSAPTYEQVEVQIVYNASAIYFGDVVQPDANGYVIIGAPGTVQIAGIFQGCKYLSTSQKRVVWSNYWPGADVASNQTVTGYIINDPNAKFIAQTGSTGATQAAVNTSVNYAVGTPNAANGLSGAYVDDGTFGLENTKPFKVVSLVTQPPGAPGTEAGAYNLVIVAFNNVQTKQLLGI